MIEAIRPPLDTDLGRTALADAAYRLGGVPIASLTIFAGSALQLGSIDLCKEFGCKFVMIPDAMLATPYTWAVQCERGIFVSKPS